jgi:hypothetical protein
MQSNLDFGMTAAKNTKVRESVRASTETQKTAQITYRFVINYFYLTD